MNTSQDNKLRIKDYLDRVSSAYAFADGHRGEVWNGLFLMGLSIQDLDLIPFSSDITPMAYWITAPPPQGDAEDWPISWITERDALHGTNKEND